MMKLTRTRVGDFQLDDTLTLNQISALVLKGEIEERIVPVDDIFRDYESITLPEEYANYLHNGNKIVARQLPDDIIVNEGSRYRVYDSDNIFIGIYILAEGVLSPVKIFYEA